MEMSVLTSIDCVHVFFYLEISGGRTVLVACGIRLIYVGSKSFNMPVGKLTFWRRNYFLNFNTSSI